ncbi:MAG: DUF4129 domain-containing protein [Chloroflexota bacterium]|nr:DUF4129 domain-containing protein [Chloroflexota bacterium]
MKSRAFSLLLGFSLFLSPHPTPTAFASTLSVAQYSQKVHRIRLQLDALVGAPAVSTSAISSIEKHLRQLDRVRLEDGAVLATNTSDLASQLSPHSQSINRRVAHQLDALDLMVRGPPGAASPVLLRSLDTVLRGPKFHQQCQNLDCALNWLGSQLQALLNRLAPRDSPSVNPLVKLLVGALLLLLMGAIAVLAARGSLRRMVVDLPPPGATDQGLNEHAARRRADDLVTSGEHRAALRYLFIATMLELQRRGALTLQPGLTNHEYVAAMRAAKSAPKTIEQPLRRLVEEFDRAWYGHLPFGPGDYQRCSALARQALDGLEPANAA